MFRQVLSATAIVALLAAASGCGNDDKAQPAGESSPGSSSASAGSPSESASSSMSMPPPAYKQVPGQAEKVRTAITAAGYTCSDLVGEYTNFTACSKPGDTDLSYLKYAADKDGTVVSAVTTSFKDAKAGVTAIVGATDAAVLLANGKTLQWGYAGPNWLSIKGMNSAPQPPMADPFDNNRASVLKLYQNDKGMSCEVTEPTATPTPESGEVTPAGTPAPAESSISCQQADLMGSDRGRIHAVFAGEKLVQFDFAADYDFKGEESNFAAVRRQVTTVFGKLWPALEGDDVDEIRTYVESQLKPMGGGIHYVGKRRVSVRTASLRGYEPKIWVSIGSEKTGLEEPKI